MCSCPPVSGPRAVDFEGPPSGLGRPARDRRCPRCPRSPHETQRARAPTRTRPKPSFGSPYAQIRTGSNFVAAILRNAREKGALDVVEPPVSSPTYADDLAAGILALLEAGAKGVVHVANNGGCSRLELATEIVRLAGLADTVELRTRVAPTVGARRPAYSVLDTSYFTRLTGQLMRPWQQALADYVVREGGPAV